MNSDATLLQRYRVATNVHSRSFPRPPVALRPYLEQAWSGTDRDIFPLDVVRSWRKNPPGSDPLALVPGVTEMGHGPFRFLLERWDGSVWRVRFEAPGMSGWHGFDLEAEGAGSRLTHTTVMALSAPMRLRWTLVIEPLHDWAVESLFDRLAAALTTGVVPERTTRPMSLYVRTLLAILRRVTAARNGPPSDEGRAPRATPSGGGRPFGNPTVAAPSSYGCRRASGDRRE